MNKSPLVAKIAVCCAFFMLLPCSRSKARSFSQSIAGVVPPVFEFDEQGNRIDILEFSQSYRYFLPEDYDPSQEYPLVLYFHGSGQIGNDNMRQITEGPTELFNRVKRDYPAILVAPQLRLGSWTPFNSFDRTDEIIETFLSDFPVDEQRIYTTGLSLGGFGATNYLAYYNAINPGEVQIAASAPTAGSFIDEFSVETLRETPVWISHGDSDDIVPTTFALESFNALAGRPLDTPFSANLPDLLAGGPTAEVGNVRYTQYTNTGHNSWTPFYSSTDLYDWLFAQSLAVPVPEPASLGSSLMAAFAITLRRRRANR